MTPTKANRFEFLKRLQRNTLGTKNDIPKPLAWGFYLFVFSIPFESARIETLGLGGGDFFNLSKVTGILVLLLALRYPTKSFSRVPSSVWAFLLYLVVFMTLGSAQSSAYEADILERLVSMVQLTVLYWIACNLFQSRDLVVGTLVSLSISISALAILQFMGITSSSLIGNTARQSFFIEDPNNAGAVFAIGLISTAGLLLAIPPKNRAFRYIAWAIVPLIVISLVRTGSRGAHFSLFAGMLAMILNYQGMNWGTRFRMSLILGLAIGSLYYVTTTNELINARWEQTIQKGATSERDVIAIIAWEMFLEDPVFGQGPMNNHTMLGWRMRRASVDTHNLFLWILTEVGIVGAIPFFSGLLLGFRPVWRARKTGLGWIVLAMFMVVLVTNLSLTWHVRKMFWIALALCQAAWLKPNLRKQTSPTHDLEIRQVNLLLNRAH